MSNPVVSAHISVAKVRLDINMNYLYLLSQTKNHGCDTYDSCIVCAESEDLARLINPASRGWSESYMAGWCNTPEQVTVERIGIAKPSLQIGVVLASFNGG